MASNLGSGGGRRKRTKYDDDVESNHSYSLRSRGYELAYLQYFLDPLDALRRLQKSFQKNQEVKKTSLEKSKKSQKC